MSSANKFRADACPQTQASGNGDCGMTNSLEYQVSEIKEEEFSPDIQQVEQFRLEQLVKTRSMLRDRREEADGYDEATHSSALISREQIQILHGQLAAVSVSEGGGLVPQAGPSTRQHNTDDHDYMNDSVVAREMQSDHEYMNQDVIDKAFADDQEIPVKSFDSRSSGQVPSSNGYSSQGNPSVRSSRYGGGRAQQPVAQPDNSNLGEFEKRLLLAKHKSKAMMPDIITIPWYHPGISRHIAEVLLLSKDIRDGTYLLRDCVSDPNTVTLSVRCQNSVKHYKVTWNGKQFIFGLGKFSTLEDFKEHFSHRPIISGESGVLVQLLFPYPRGVSEPAIYLEATEVSNVIEEVEASQKPNTRAAKLSNSLDLSINSKEGYLTKLGFHRKNWKKRWFVLYKSELKYFNCAGDKDPLKVINLEDVMRIDRDDTAGKSNCFRIVTPYRTFFMYATSEVEANEWVQILDWRLKQQSKR